MTLNLEVKTDSERMILNYLEQNASERLADKINNGVPIEKDGKTLINKKTLSGFVAYATENAKKLAEKGTNGIFIDDNTVYGWAMHYFQEDSIEEVLHNNDGTEYKLPVKTPPIPTPSSPPQKKQEPQMSLFEIMSNETKEEPQAEVPKPKAEERKPTSVYQNYMQIQEKYPDAVIVYRLGDFYEVFDKNAVLIAGDLELTLTSRDCGLLERVPMIGFPYHCAAQYIGRLTNFGYTVAVAEDLEHVSIFSPTDNEQQEEDGKHWLDENTYVDEDGIVHENEIQTKAFDTSALAILSDLFGELLDLQ